MRKYNVTENTITGGASFGSNLILPGSSVSDECIEFTKRIVRMYLCLLRVDPDCQRKYSDWQWRELTRERINPTRETASERQRIAVRKRVLA